MLKHLRYGITILGLSLCGVSITQAEESTVNKCGKEGIAACDVTIDQEEPQNRAIIHGIPPRPACFAERLFYSVTNNTPVGINLKKIKVLINKKDTLLDTNAFTLEKTDCPTSNKKLGAGKYCLLDFILDSCQVIGPPSEGAGILDRKIEIQINTAQKKATKNVTTVITTATACTVGAYASVQNAINPDGKTAISGDVCLFSKTEISGSTIVNLTTGAEGNVTGNIVDYTDGNEAAYAESDVMNLVRGIDNMDCHKDNSFPAGTNLADVSPLVPGVYCVTHPILDGTLVLYPTTKKIFYL